MIILPLNDEEEKTKGVLPEDILVEIATFDKGPKVLNFEELKVETDNFSARSKIRGFVHRGVFRWEILVIMRMGIDVSKEVNILTKINHFNLIKLNEHHRHFYLAYEYMENDSLREWLHNKSSRETESWTCRIQIALDVANGINYLHNFTKPAYVHKDIKSSNVLLDSNLRAKIGNFSLSDNKNCGH
ncbi:unnamed protein product [Ilex paraguariensis]|uniref:Protein kinase domain-containing protein n=1 Tax=Ilex paraguariensis TaxID=185542 RepID=A0ABC8TY86_9AQUA